MALVGLLLVLAGYPKPGASPAAARPFELGALMLLLGAVGVGYISLWAKNVRLLVGTDRFGYRGAFGRVRTWSQGDVARVVSLVVKQSDSPPISNRLIYFLRPDGSRLFILNPRAWREVDVDRLARAAGKPLEVLSEPMSISEFKTAFPRATTWVGRHTTLAGGLLVIAVAAIVLLVGLLPEVLQR